MLWYATNFHLSNEEAEHRLNLQAEMSPFASRIIDGEPTYAGSWVEHEPEFGLVVAFASSDGKEFIKKYLAEIEWADLVRVQERPYTFNQLEEILDQVNLAAHKTDIPFASGLAPQNVASITIFTPYLKELRAQLEADTTIQPYLNLINFVYQASLSEPAEVKYPYRSFHYD